MSNQMPPSGLWRGYYFYGDGGMKHRMHLNLTFGGDGGIAGDGVDDVGTFVISGLFDLGTSQASWTKEYLGMHTVEYSGLYCQRQICGDWRLGRLTGGFWIWPGVHGDFEFGEEGVGVEEPVEASIASLRPAR
jgi:hypothetical protein